MYKLNEQPISTILEEMEDFKPLADRVGIYRVKEKFAEQDTVYEKGDLVALCGYGDDDRIIFIPYENYLRIRTRTMPDFLSGMKEDKECVVTSLLLSTFHSRFELCLPETERIEEIRNKAIKLSKEKKNQLAAEYDVGDLHLFFVVGIFTELCGIFFILHKKTLGSIMLMLGVPLCIIGVIFMTLMIQKSILNVVNDKKNLKILLKYEGIFKEMDERRKANGMFISQEK
ncbi:MAG: hypothetical protein IKH75_10105 [Ruminococcus sp.]|nr:hypothetical protein [Ruminococcus sp.]